MPLWVDEAGSVVSCSSSQECMEADVNRPICSSSGCSQCVSDGECAVFDNATCFAGLCKSAFDDAFDNPMTIPVFSVAGVLYCLSFFACLALWRLHERSVRYNRLKRFYQDAMREFRKGIDLLLLKAAKDKPLPEPLLEIQDGCSASQEEIDSESSEPSDKPTYDIVGLANDYEFSSSSDSLMTIPSDSESDDPSKTSSSSTKSSESEELAQKQSISSDEEELQDIAFAGLSGSDTESSSGYCCEESSSSEVDPNVDSSSSIDLSQMKSV
eukprot:TRINITY_DN6327_c0_g1_i2.p2 TRINITY_DN6327_c0_g1~~TRINITY_DN6327_c0_g1_i2.p2  ORF type:complete len:270 (-),score=56.29 TRINITY_DN6327_c0_g1_i2:20-829(-)